MTPTTDIPHLSATSIGLATERWPTTAPTGARTAGISSASPSIGEVIALHDLAPATCPQVHILNRRGTLFIGGRRRTVPILTVGSRHMIAVRLRCDWTVRCVGAVGLFDFDLAELAAGNISVPAGQVRTVLIPICTATPKCPLGPDAAERKRLRGRQSIDVVMQLLVTLPNGQLTFGIPDGTSFGLVRLNGAYG